MRNFNNIRTIDLREYLPEVLKDVQEMRAIMEAETPEVQAIWDACEDCMNDQFIMEATENGVARREKMLKITPFATDTLDDRKLRLLSRYNENIPYTRRSLEALLESLCGAGGYILTINIKILHEPFDRDKLIASGLKILTFVVGLTLLCTSITALPLFATQVGWAIPEEYSDLFADLVIIGSVLLVSCKYIKEAYTKFVAILNDKGGAKVEQQ